MQLPTGGYLLVGGLPQIPDMPSDSVERFRAVRGQLAYPDFPPPIGLSREGSDGTLWLSRFDDGGDLARWLLFDREGTPLGELALPREHRILWSGEDRIWVVEPDEFDIPWLVRYRLTGGL